jgi:hypothetical protein
MRMRIEEMRTRRGRMSWQSRPAGRPGGCGVHSLALCLELAGRKPTVRALERARRGKLLPGADQLIAIYRRLRRRKASCGAWSDEAKPC